MLLLRPFLAKRECPCGGKKHDACPTVGNTIQTYTATPANCFPAKRSGSHNASMQRVYDCVQMPAPHPRQNSISQELKPSALLYHLMGSYIWRLPHRSKSRRLKKESERPDREKTKQTRDPRDGAHLNFQGAIEFEALDRYVSSTGDHERGSSGNRDSGRLH